MQNDVNDIDYNGMLLTWVVFFLIIAVFYFIARSFNRLARKYDQKESWLFGLVGIVIFFMSAGMIGLIEPFLRKVDLYNPRWFPLARTTFGFLCCLGVYKYLSREWQRKSNR